MRRLLTALLLAIVSARADIIPANRVAPWQGNVGVPGGIPDYPVYRIVFPSDDKTGATDRASIQSALSSCPDQMAVLLANGHFYVNDLIDWAGINRSVCLRGSGPFQTLITLTVAPARLYLRPGSFDEDALNIDVNLAQNCTQFGYTVTPASMESWMIPGNFVGIDQVDDEPKGATDVGQEGNSTYRKILGHEVMQIDSFPANVSNWTPDASATVTWFSDTPPAEAGQSGPGVMKLTGNFTASSTLQTASATYTLPTPVNAALDYTRVYVWYKVDAGSSARTSGDYGTLKFVLKNGAGLTAINGETAILESRASAGWLSRNLATFAFTNNASDVRAIQLQIGGTDMTGPVTVYIDAIKLVGGRGMMNTLKIASVTSSNFTTALPLVWAWQTNRHAQVFKLGTPLKRSGIENFAIEAAYEATGLDNAIMEMCDGCWYRNIWSRNSPGRSLITYGVFLNQCEIRDSFGDSSHHYGAGQAYGIALYHGSYGCLIENNIIKKYHAGLSADYGTALTVFSYNYVFDPFADQPQTPAMSTHGTHTMFVLFEGNLVETKVLGDFTHGSSSDITLLRNRVQGYNFGRQFDQAAISIEMWNRRWNVVGNVLGVYGLHTNYSIGPDASWTISTNNFDQELKSIYEMGYYLNYGGSILYGSDSAVTMDPIIHGNWDAANHAVVWDSGIADHVIPDSYYLAAKPGWWPTGVAWPPIEPTTTTTNNINAITIPAKARYDQFFVPPIYVEVLGTKIPIGAQAK
jgi:hypothetical protein